MRISVLFATGFVLLISLLAVSDFSIAQTGNIWTSSSAIVDEKRSFSPTSVPIDASKTTPCKRYMHTDVASNTKEYCVFSTGKYTITDDAKIIVFGLSSIIPIENKSNPSGLLIPLPSSTDMVEVRGSGSTAKVVLIRNAYTSMGTVTQSNGSTKKLITSTNQKVIRDTLNSTDLYTNKYRNISANGNWFVSQNGNGIYKLNTLTEDIQYIRGGIPDINGLDAELSLSITNDGRYVAVYSGREQRFEIIDTKNCQVNNPNIGINAKCQFNDYMKTITNNIADINLDQQFKNVNFVSNSSVRFYAYTNWVSGAQYKLKELVLSSDKKTLSTLDYLAMGDSYASGEGIFNYKSITNEDINTCHLSEMSYPYSLINKGIVGSGESIACSGARMKDVIDIRGIAYTRDSPQANFYTSNFSTFEILSNNIPGGVRQLEFVKAVVPNIITLSVGGNDMGFSKIITSCVASTAECYNTRQERQRLVSVIESTYRNLVRTYTEIKDVNQNARIYIIGYPQVAKVDGNCAANVGLTNNEIIFTRDLISYLNSIIEMASTEAGVYYTDSEYAFEGRRLCEVESNLSAMNGLTAGPDSGLSKPISTLTGLSGPLGQESYHPNIFGHNMFSKKIIEETKSLTAPMPNQIPGNPYTDSVEKMAFLNAVEMGDEYGMNAYYDESISGDNYLRNSQIDVAVDGETYFIKPNSKVRIYAYSSPTLIGTATADSAGSIAGTFSIPGFLEPGYHTLHIYATNIENKAIDIQKIVYVAASENDYDGDGIKNEDERCLVGDAANVDIDGDEIDDACDGFIGEPKTSEEPPVTVPDPQPEQPPKEEPQQPSEKELPQSESRPDWLLMKEREYADEQAVANQSATIAQTTTTPIAIVTTQSDNQPATRVPNTASEAPANEQPTASTTTKQNTTVAGVSSAVESKPDQHNSTAWYIYALLFIIAIVGSIGFYRAVSVKNRV